MFNKTYFQFLKGKTYTVLKFLSIKIIVYLREFYQQINIFWLLEFELNYVPFCLFSVAMKIYHLSCVKVLLHEMPLEINNAQSN